MTKPSFTRSDFDTFLAQHRLMAARCPACSELYVPPRPLCPSCFGEDMAWVELSGEGILRACTAVHIAPTAMTEAGYGRDNPYLTGIVELAEGPRISAQILGFDPGRPEEIPANAPLRADFVDRGTGEERRTFLVFRRH